MELGTGARILIDGTTPAVGRSAPLPLQKENNAASKMKILPSLWKSQCYSGVFLAKAVQIRVVSSEIS